MHKVSYSVCRMGTRHSCSGNFNIIVDRTLCCSLNVLILRIHLCLNILYICMYICISIYRFISLRTFLGLFISFFCLFCGSLFNIIICDFVFFCSFTCRYFQFVFVFVRLDNIFGPQSNVLPCFLCVFVHDYVIDYI